MSIIIMFTYKEIVDNLRLKYPLQKVYYNDKFDEAMAIDNLDEACRIIYENSDKFRPKEYK